MKRLFMLLMCFLAIMAASLSAKAQEVTITLYPGWTWISYPKAEVMDINTALGDFVPVEGDIIQSQFSNSKFIRGRWVGGLTHFMPGWGYKYYSNRSDIVSFVFADSTPQSQVTVTTSEPMLITAVSAMGGGEVTDSGSSGVLVRGVCWSTQQTPTINDPHTTDGYGMGSFSSAVEGLEMNTTYYVRAYAMTTVGTGYGEQMMFSTKNGVPVLTTSAVSEIGRTWAACGGDISDDGGMEVTDRGICWSTSPNPTIEDNHSSDGAGLGGFTVYMYNLQSNTTYYVRAYATNSYTTAYGNEVSFTTLESDGAPVGAISGKFTINPDGDQVYFSQGNLQYQASTNIWRFAENQYDVIGSDNSNISPTYDGWIDLFGWGTSGWNNGNVYYQPYDYEHLTEWNAYEFAYGYGPTDGTNYYYSLTGTFANADWGVNNAIMNGGNVPNQWRTLTFSEWNWVLEARSTPSGIRFAKACVNNMNGVVLLPDNWNSFICELNYTNRSDAPFYTNVISMTEWEVMEANGAVFLATAGAREGVSVGGVGSVGGYWSSSHYDQSTNDAMQYARCTAFGSDWCSSWSNSQRYAGKSVRLVHVVE